jgi:hypothetical protein
MDTPPLPASVKQFRKVIDLFKHNILENKLIDKGKHDLTYFNEAGRRIHEFGNVLKYIVNGKKYDSNPTIENILKFFKDNGVDLSNIDDNDRDLYLHYITTDTYTATYSLLPKK